MMMTKIAAFTTATLAICLYAAPASAQRSWVSGTGNDVASCSRAAPCLTFAAAIAKTVAGGEINCLDPGDFGVVNITISITIDCEGTLGSILASGTNGIIVNAAGINVQLRNLTINGAGTPAGIGGIRFLAGSSLVLDRVHIMNFNSVPAVGIGFAPNSANAVLSVNNSSIVSNGLAPATGGGIVVQPAAGGTNALVTVHNSTIQRNGGSGILVNTANGSAIVTVGDSTISHNTNGGVRSVATGSSTVLIERTKINSNSAFGVSSENSASTVRVGSSTIHANAIGMQTLGGVLRSYQNNQINGNGGGEGPFTQEFLR